ncbi:hypothetical protein KXQ82_18220 [Mucilaginibacter sp. HMF5004]|uniref:hypothetical protein n=1 Tax=Mucilaginibacter rivuli TaxID=2857527 RepID=UPI001C5FCF9C|nr:hypothetical protein [Mucilaginibacter rivuli]MBW4891668.1 hypothetical protein [Mucilaginibacter rivuli]
MLFIGNSTFAQYSTKQLINGNVKSVKTGDFYTYNRTGDSYESLSILTEQVGTGTAKPTYTLDFIYTNSTSAKAAKVVFLSAADTSLNFSAQLIDNGTQYIDNPKFHSNKFHIILTDTTMATLSELKVKSILLYDINGQILTTLEVNNPSFLSQQFASIQNAIKLKPALKKTVKKKPLKRTRAINEKRPSR